MRVAIAERELANHDKQVEQSKEVDGFLRDKFTSAALYDWMVGQLSALFFQSYQMAYDLARRAERDFQHEIGDDQASFIQFGNWDSLKRGLLSGERLHFDLKRMEIAWLDQNRRELEITRHVSLATLDPEALLALRATGQCFIELPEKLFDADFPGHYLRRLKTVSLSVPCVTGPFQGVNSTLTLLWHKVRLDASVKAPRFRTASGAVQSIVASSGQNDAGLFETSLRDERFLPFEGAGAISQWRLEIPADTNSFDRATLTDVILHLRYTARDGGEALPADRRANLGLGPLTVTASGAPTDEPKRVRLFSVAHDFADAWYLFLHQPDNGAAQTLSLDLTTDLFPTAPPGKRVRIDSVKIVLIPATGVDRAQSSPSIAIDNGEGGKSGPKALAGDGLLDGLPSVAFQEGGFLREASAADDGKRWTISVTAIPGGLGTPTRLDPRRVDDIAVLSWFSLE